MEKIIVSIIIPVYNVEKYIYKCVMSLLHQTYNDIEIILVDDGSTDNSGDICDQLQEKYENVVKVFHKKNEGAGAARNFGLSIASGMYCMFVDSDDWLDEDCIEKCVNTICDNSRLDCVIFPYKREYDSKSYPQYILGEDHKLYVFDDIEKNVLLRKLVGPYGIDVKNPDSLNDLTSPWGKLYLKSYLDQIRFPVKDVITKGEDCWFNVLAISKMKRVYYLPNTFYHYNKCNNSSVVHSYKNDMLKQFYNQWDFLDEFIVEHRLNESFSIALRNRVAFSLLELVLNIINSRMSISKKLHEINKVVNDERLHNALMLVPIDELSWKWKIYYIFAKNKNAMGVFIMTILANKLKKYLR